jgi:hypothetical protein
LNGNTRSKPGKTDLTMNDSLYLIEGGDETQLVPDLMRTAPESTAEGTRMSGLIAKGVSTGASREYREHSGRRREGVMLPKLPGQGSDVANGGIKRMW